MRASQDQLLVSQGDRNKNENKQMGPNETYKLLHSKENHKKKKKNNNVKNGRKHLQMMQQARA